MSHPSQGLSHSPTPALLKGSQMWATVYLPLPPSHASTIYLQSFLTSSPEQEGERGTNLFLLFWGPGPLHSNSGTRKQATPVSSRGPWTEDVYGSRKRTKAGHSRGRPKPFGQQCPEKKGYGWQTGTGISKHSRPYPATNSPPTCRLSEQQGKLIIRLLRMR